MGSRIIDNTSKNLIGKNLKEIRISLNLSQQDIANRLETYGIYICRGSISRIEDLSRTVTDMELLGLSMVLNVPVETLLDKNGIVQAD